MKKRIPKIALLVIVIAITVITINGYSTPSDILGIAELKENYCISNIANGKDMHNNKLPAWVMQTGYWIFQVASVGGWTGYFTKVANKAITNRIGYPALVSVNESVKMNKLN